MATLTLQLQRRAVAHVQRDADRLGATSCRCGQDLDLSLGSHCPRCGTCLPPH